MIRSVSRETLRLAVQSIFLAFFLWLFSSLSYPLGPEGPIYQWFSRLDPWYLFSWLRWHGSIPFWAWVPLGALLVALLKGRRFCSWICPMGAILALTDRLGQAMGAGRLLRLKIKVWNTLEPLRHYWLLLLVAAFLLGSGALVFLTPFSLLSHEGMRAVRGFVPWILIGIIAVTLVFSRIWCGVICPTGLLLSLVAQLRFGRKK